MGEPRWTVEESEDGPRLMWRWPGVELSYIDRKYVRRVSTSAFDALVAAVRDADLLRQARDFIALKLSDAWLDDEDVHDLLDLLSSPVADSREGTG